MYGEYKEKLSCSNGEMIVKKGTWSIQYYFPGIDRRHNGTFVNIAGNDIDKYIEAYKRNWKIYSENKEKFPDKKSELCINGERGMKVYINGYFDGICLKDYHMPINKENNLKSLISAFENAKNRSVKIMNMLKEI